MSRWLRRIAYVIGTLVVLIVLLGGFVFVKSSSMLTKTYDPPVEPLAMVRDSTTLARGEHLATVISKCVECHAADLGGSIFIDDPALGRIVAPNLTKGQGGAGVKYTDAQMAVVVRHGIKIDSTSVLVMPAEVYQGMSDEDVDAIVAYVRSVPDVDRTLPLSSLGPVGRALTAAGQLPIYTAALVALDREHPARVERDTSLAYGTYLANIGGCTGCHGANLSGGKIPGTPPDWPPASNLTPTGIGRYTDAQIEHILRTGKRPDGSQVNDIMPWRFSAKMTDEEIATTIKYLRSVPAKEFGVR